MKTTFTTEQRLKALLLVVLAANIGGVGGFAAHESLKTTDLASVSETVEAAPSVTIPTSQAPLPISPRSVTLPNKLRVPTVPVLPRGQNAKNVPAAAPVEEEIGAVPEEANPNKLASRPAATGPVFRKEVTICGVPLQLVFAEKIEKGQKKTVVGIKDKFESEDTDIFETSLIIAGSPKENGLDPKAPNKTAKAEVDRAIAIKATKLLSEAGRCEAQTAQRGQPREVVETGPNPTRRPTRRDEVRRGGAESIRATLNRIAALGDITDENEARGRARAERELEKLVKGDLYPTLKGMLMSRNRSDEAQALIDDAIEQIESLGSDSQIDSRRVNRLVSSLKGLKYGAETYQRSLEFGEEVKSLREDFQNSRSQGGQVMPEQMQQLQELQMRMQQEIAAGPYGQLAQYRSYMNAADVTAFLQPYQNLQREMQLIMNPNAGVNGGLGGIGGLQNGPGGFPGGAGQFPGAPGQFPGGQPGIQPGFPGGLQPGTQGGPFGNPGLLNRGPVFGGLGGLGGAPGTVMPGVTPLFAQPSLGTPSGLQGGFGIQPGLGFAGSPLGYAGAPIGGGFGSPVIGGAMNPIFSQPAAFNQSPFMTNSSFGYGSPSPFAMNQSPLFARTTLLPQYYAPALPTQAILTPPGGLGSIGAYANFSINLGSPSAFSTSPLLGSGYYR